MAPGCFTMEQQHDQQQQQQYNDINTSDMLIINESNYDLDNYNITTQPIITINNKPATVAANSIPLPSTPYPTVNTSSKNKNHSLSIRSKLFDTVDSFEILEQTIMKQKRLGRMKNVDLRKKVLLKRTFDLVCEIMDHENGFEEEDEEDTQSKEKIVPKSKEVNDSDRNSSDEEEEEEEQESDSDDSSDEEDEQENDSNIQSLPSIQTFTSLETLAQTPSQVDSQIKLVDTNNEMPYINTILNEESLFNYNTLNYSNLSNYSSSSSSNSLKRKLSNTTTTTTQNNSANKKAKIQRRPSNISDEDEEEEEEDDEDNLYGQDNFICLYDDDNDPFGIADVVNSNYSSFKN